MLSAVLKQLFKKILIIILTLFLQNSSNFVPEKNIGKVTYFSSVVNKCISIENSDFNDQSYWGFLPFFKNIRINYSLEKINHKYLAIEDSESPVMGIKQVIEAMGLMVNEKPEKCSNNVTTLEFRSQLMIKTWYIGILGLAVNSMRDRQVFMTYETLIKPANSKIKRNDVTIKSVAKFSLRPFKNHDFITMKKNHINRIIEILNNG